VHCGTIYRNTIPYRRTSQLVILPAFATPSLNTVNVQALMAASTYRSGGRAVDLGFVPIVLAPRAVTRLTTDAFQIRSSRCIYKSTLAEPSCVARKAFLILFPAHVDEQFKCLGVRDRLPRLVCVGMTHLALTGTQILGAGRRPLRDSARAVHKQYRENQTECFPHIFHLFYYIASFKTPQS
jgi:hypothetical protein